jgi:hypothetical protein
MIEISEKRELESIYGVIVHGKTVGKLGGVYYELECVICGEEIHHQSEFRIKEGRGKYCSHKCNAVARKGTTYGPRRNPVKQHKRKEKVFIKRICPVCGTEYDADIDRLKWSRQTTCSRECSYEYRYAPMRTREIVELRCDECGGVFYRDSRWLEMRKGEPLYYSRKCIAKNYPTGEKAYNWQGGKTAEQQLIRASQEYKEWLLGVMKRDNFTCQSCGANGSRQSKLQVHHLYYFSKFEELRMVPWNGITLCKKCHTIIHQRDREITKENEEVEEVVAA